MVGNEAVLSHNACEKETESAMRKRDGEEREGERKERERERKKALAMLQTASRRDILRQMKKCI